MLFGFILTSLIVCSIIGLGSLVFLKNRHNITNKMFAILAFWIVVFIVSNFWENEPIGLNLASLSLRIDFASASFMVYFWLVFCIRFPRPVEYFGKIKHILLALPAIFFALLSFSPWLIYNIRLGNRGIDFDSGYLYSFYAVYIVGYMLVCSCGALIFKYHKAHGLEKAQILYVTLGVAISATIGIVFNLFLQRALPVELFRVGIYGIIFFVVFTTYAIVKYRLMDIRVVIGKTAVYLLSFLFTIGLCFLLMFGNSRLAQPVSQNVFLPLIIITAVLLYQFFFKIFEKIASRFFYYSFYSSQKVLTELGKKLVMILDISELSNTIAQTLMSTMKLDRAVVLFREKTGRFIILKNIGFKEENGISLVKDNFLTEFLEKTQKPLVFEELFLAERDANTEEERTSLHKLQDNMKNIEAIVCLPLFRGKDITGIIILGKKLSGDSYSREDINLLSILTNQVAVALQNAFLYDQVSDLSQNLQEKVDEQTKELRKALIELQKVDKAKSEFISMASHQLRTPLTAIKGYLSMIIDGDFGETTKKMQKPMANMALSIERLVKLVNDLLSISKIELGNVKIDKKPVKIEEVLQSCFDELKIKAKEKKLKFIFQKPKEKLPEIMANELAIRQIILNLLDNAIHYTPKGEVVLSAEVENNNILIKVQDAGQGISEQEMPNLFKSFSRGSAGTDLFIEGTGLGLSVAKKYTDLHQGKIWAESSGIDKGSTFFLQLPIK